jgi:hypothetical protein
VLQAERCKVVQAKGETRENSPAFCYDGFLLTPSFVEKSDDKSQSCALICIYLHKGVKVYFLDILLCTKTPSPILYGFFMKKL